MSSKQPKTHIEVGTKKPGRSGAGLGDGSGGTNWQLYSAQTTLPSNAAYVEFYAEVHGFGDTDTSLTTAYFDSAFMDGVPVWAQTFGYDPFGNINKTGNSSFNPSYSSTTNRMMQIGSSTPTYDANGNQNNDFLHTYAWDANGRPVTVDGVGITYDALGRMVEQNPSGAHTQKIYSPTGFQMQIVNGQTSVYSFSPMPGGGSTVWSAPAGTVYYRHADWLGSSRFASTYTRTVFYDGAYAPFGEQYANSGTSDLSFTGMDSDTSSNLYDFPAREYGIQGRWPSPDPAGLAAVDPSDPQSWNRYAYVRNSPTENVDPTGMMRNQLQDPADGGDGGGFGGDYVTFDLGGSWWDGTMGSPGDIWGDYGAGTDQSGIWGESAPGGFQPFPPIFSGGANPGGSSCTYGSGSCGGWAMGWTTGPNGQPVGEYNGDQFCTLFSTNGSCLSAVFWFGNSQNGGWSPVDHTTPSQRSKSPAIRKCEDAAAVAAYNKNVSTDINAAKKPIEGALSGAATGCIRGTNWGLGEGCAAGATGGAAKGAVAGVLTGAWSMIHDAVGPAACKQ